MISIVSNGGAEGDSMDNIMQVLRRIRIFILFSWIPLIAIKAYSIEIKEVNIDPECRNELYAEENFDFLHYLNKFSERLKNYKDGKDVSLVKRSSSKVTSLGGL